MESRSPPRLLDKVQTNSRLDAIFHLPHERAVDCARRWVLVGDPSCCPPCHVAQPPQPTCRIAASLCRKSTTQHDACAMRHVAGTWGTEEGGISRVLFGCAGRYRGMVRHAHSFVWGATCCICSLDGPAGQKGVRVELRVSLQADTVQIVSSRRCSSGPETWTDGSRQHVEKLQRMQLAL